MSRQVVRGQEETRTADPKEGKTYKKTLAGIICFSRSKNHAGMYSAIIHPSLAFQSIKDHCQTPTNVY